MTDTVLTCPNCGHAIPLSEALTAQLREQLEIRLHADHEARLKDAVAQAQTGLQTRVEVLTRQIEEQARDAREAEARELDLKRRAMELEESGRILAERTRLEVEERLRAENEEKVRALVGQAESRVRGESALEVALLKEQLTSQQHKAEEAQRRELELVRRAAELEQKQRELDLELERRLAAARIEEEKRLRQLIGNEQALKLAERDKQIDDLRRVIDDLKRKSEQGSQERQGEVLELDIESALAARFPQDLIKPVPKGARGADIVQEVRNEAFESCGHIVWESKNTRHWSPAWIEKLKDDQRATGSAIAVLVSVALPEDMRGFGLKDGVWVASLQVWPALAIALRQQLIEVSHARAVTTGVSAKMELLYNYLSGHEFRGRVEAIVEAFTVMRGQLDRERRAITKHWAEREKQIGRVIASTTGMYGALAGIIGTSLPTIPALELDDTRLLEDNDA